MKVVGLKEFLALPVGTVFCELGDHDQIISYWNIKQESIQDYDYFYQELPDTNARPFDARWLNNNVLDRKDYECNTRWGMYDNEAKFCVLDKKEVGKLIGTLYYTMNTLIKTMEEN